MSKIAATLAGQDEPRSALVRRFAANRLALASLALIVLLTIMATWGPRVWTPSATAQDYNAINAWPSPQHPLGADNLGRDTLARLLRGLRVSLLMAVYVETLNILLGATLGLLAGYFGGWLDQLLSRLADMLFAFPGLLLAILVAGIFGSSMPLGGIGRLLLVAGALSLVSWPLMARTVRSLALTLRQREFVEAARAVGAGDGAILRRHLLPNIMGLVIVSATLDVAGVVVNEAVLSLLGLGVQPPAPSIGGMIVQAIPFLEVNWLQVFWPSLALLLLVLAFSFLGDGLRDAFDPT